MVKGSDIYLLIIRLAANLDLLTSHDVAVALLDSSPIEPISHVIRAWVPLMGSTASGNFRSKSA